MAKREIDIILKARNEASREIKQVRADMESIGGIKLSGLVGTFKNVVAHVEAAKLAMIPITAISKAIRGDWEGLWQSVARLPFGLGELAQIGRELYNELSGAAAEADRIAEIEKQRKERQAETARYKSLSLSIAQREMMIGKEGIELQELQIELGYRRQAQRIKEAELTRAQDTEELLRGEGRLRDRQLAYLRRKEDEKDEQAMLNEAILANKARGQEAYRVEVEAYRQQESLLDRIEDLRIASLRDGHQRQLAMINLRYRRETEIAREAGRDITLLERARALEIANLKAAGVAGKPGATETRALGWSLEWRPMENEARKQTKLLEWLKLLGHLPQMVRELIGLRRGQAGTARVEIGPS